MIISQNPKDDETTPYAALITLNPGTITEFYSDAEKGEEKG